LSLGARANASKLCLTTLVVNTSSFRQQRRVFCKGLTNQELVDGPLITSSCPPFSTNQFKSEKSVSKTFLNDTQYHEEIILKNHKDLRPKKNLSDTQCHKEIKNNSHKQGKHLNYV
jgi:hypothetical protein